MSCIAPPCERPKNTGPTDPNDSVSCAPIDSLVGVLEWEPPKSSWAGRVVPRTRRTKFVFSAGSGSSRLLAPKTLVCHDMKGGYLEDRLVEGCDDSSAFNFFRWSGVDIFVYFSHKFCTIPPVTWINAAHKNGVTVLGTLITEGESGEQMCSELLDDRETVQRLCDKLTAIAAHYGFSGFLLNIENVVRPEHMANLLFLVRELRSQLSSSSQDNLLLWYDSVDESSGRLDWQNALNHKNRSFFESCDGIFLNYCWSVEDLELSATNAGNRQLDVFVGVDVFGRGCLGGGGFNCSEAMSLIRQHNLSAAIFAPGWVHELQDDDVEGSFLRRDFEFWARLANYLLISGPAQLPFETSFCVGAGQNLYHRGKVSKKGQWHNLCRQDCQTSELASWAGEVDEDVGGVTSVCYYDRDAYNGGTCLLLIRPRPLEKCHEHRLFVCEFRTTEYDYLILKVSVKLLKEEFKGNFELYVKTQSDSGMESKVYLTPDKDNYHKLSHKRWVNRAFSTDPGIGLVVEIGYRMTQIDSILLGRLVVVKELLTL